jgi:hypothetical protein
MSMSRAKESLTIGAEDSLRESNTSLFNRNSRMCPVPPRGVLKGLNTSFAAVILRDPPGTDQMTAERKEGRFRREVGSKLFRRMTMARFASLLGIRNPTPRLALPSPVTERTMHAPVSLPPFIRKFPAQSSSHIRSRPRSRTMSSTRPDGKSPQDLILRRRTRSAPQPPQSLRSPSPHLPRRRASTGSLLYRRNNSSDSRPTTRGEFDEKWALNP